MIAHFKKVYIELTNICGLKCSFCPPKSKPTKTLTLDQFEHILIEISPYTKDIALHVMGDPLVLKDLQNYLDLILKYQLKAHITTSGYYLEEKFFVTLLHKAIYQINFSLNSFNKNDLTMSFENYLGTIAAFCKFKNENRRDLFINLRLWNIDDSCSENTYNQKVFGFLKKYFDFELLLCDYKNPFRIDNKVLIHFDNYFQWPSLKLEKSSNGYCHGLSSQIAILADGTVVPCCLDCDGIIGLGNIYKTSLKSILTSKKTQNIINGFKNNIAVEPLCQKCTFKNRFNKTI